MGKQQAIYFFAPTAKNIAKFETIDDEITLQSGYYFTSQLVVTGQTNIKTNFFDREGVRQLAKITKSYFCTGFEFNQITHDFIMSFDDVHYFGGEYAQKNAENFMNGIANNS